MVRSCGQLAFLRWVCLGLCRTRLTSLALHAYELGLRQMARMLPISVPSTAAAAPPQCCACSLRSAGGCCCLWHCWPMLLYQAPSLPAVRPGYLDWRPQLQRQLQWHLWLASLELLRLLLL
jgi:hypothetical protein